MRTRNNSVFGHFPRSECDEHLIELLLQSFTRKKTKPWCSFPRGIFLRESSKGRWIDLNALLRVGICPVKTFPSLHLPAQI